MRFSGLIKLRNSKRGNDARLIRQPAKLAFVGASPTPCSLPMTDKIPSEDFGTGENSLYIKVADYNRKGVRQDLVERNYEGVTDEEMEEIKEKVRESGYVFRHFSYNRMGK